MAVVVVVVVVVTMTMAILSVYYAVATVFQVYHGSDMMYEMKRRRPEPTLLLTEGIFNLPHHVGMV